MKGTGILDLAALFRRTELLEEKSADDDFKEDEMFDRLLEGGDVDGDLRVLYWDNPENLEAILLSTIVNDMETSTGLKLDPECVRELWDAYFRPDGQSFPERSQVLTPYRGELIGTEHLNLSIQYERAARLMEMKGTLGGVTYFDKVIQIRNRTGRERLWAYNANSRKNEPVDLYNGEIGTAIVHGFDSKKWEEPKFRNWPASSDF